MADSFVLGLSSGTACLVTCGMIMFPYLMAGSAGIKQIAFNLAVFLLTRLMVYFVLATIAWYFGQALFTTIILRNYLPGVLYIIFAALLIWYSVDKNRKRDCLAAIIKTVDNRKLVPVLLGIVNSIGFCPALLIILTKGATQDTLARSYIAFLAFFAGSSLWFVPLPFAGMAKRRQVLQIIGTFATGIAGIIFIIKGITMLIGGIING
jgi:hypothetical protein